MVTQAQYSHYKDLASGVIEKLRAKPSESIRCSTAVTKVLLLHYPTIIIGGNIYVTACKSIGAGVHEVSVKQKEY